MKLKTSVDGKVTLIYHDPHFEKSVSRTFYQSGGWVFEERLCGDFLMDEELGTSKVQITPLRATQSTLASEIRKAYKKLVKIPRVGA
jgi:hypothetical protein